MNINASNYRVFYNVLRDKFIKDFYEGQAEGINEVAIWHKRFPKNEDSRFGNNEVIAKVLFDLDDKGRYFHTKLKEAEKSPAIFSVKARRLYKALVYLKEGYSNDPASFNQRVIYEQDIKREALALWGEFEREYVLLPNSGPQTPPSEP